MARKNHEGNMVYQHDLSNFAVGQHNCLTDPIDIFLEHGITLKQCDIRPANSLSTAFQLIAVNFQVQSLEQFGGISASHLDWSMIPYFRKSFFKHYKNWCDGIPLMKWAKPNIDSKSIKHISVDDRIYTGVGLLKPLKKMIWKKAWNSTLKELSQSIVLINHNLNTFYPTPLISTLQLFFILISRNPSNHCSINIQKSNIYYIHSHSNTINKYPKTNFPNYFTLQYFILVPNTITILIILSTANLFNIFTTHQQLSVPSNFSQSTYLYN